MSNIIVINHAYVGIIVGRKFDTRQEGIIGISQPHTYFKSDNYELKPMKYKKIYIPISTINYFVDLSDVNDESLVNLIKETFKVEDNIQNDKVDKEDERGYVTKPLSNTGDISNVINKIREAHKLGQVIDDEWIVLLEKLLPDKGRLQQIRDEYFGLVIDEAVSKDEGLFRILKAYSMIL